MRQHYSTELEYWLSQAESNQLFRVNPVQMHRCAQKAYSQALQISNDKALARSIVQLASLALERAEYSTAISLYKQALPRFEIAGEWWHSAMVKRYLGITYILLGKHQIAESYLLEVLEIARAKKDIDLQGQVEFSLALLSKKQGRLDFAVSYNVQILRDLDRLNPPLGGFACMGLATIHDLLRDEARVEEYVMLGLQLTNKNILLDKSACQKASHFDLFLMGQLHLLAHQPTEAIPYLTEALEYFGTYQFLVSKVQCLLELAKAYLHTNDLATAEEFLKQATSDIGAVPDKEVHWEVKNLYAKYLLEIEQPQAAYDLLLLLAKHSSTATFNTACVLTSLSLIIEACERTNRYIEATKYYRVLQEKQEPLFALSNQRKIVIAALSIEAGKEGTSTNANGLQALQLLQKESELAQARVKLEEHREVIQKVYNEVRSVEKQYGESSSSWVKPVVDLLQVHLPPQRFYGIDQLELGEIQKRVREAFPMLSKMEVQVAALVCLGIETEKIAQLCAISLRTAEGHRLNIRRKLQLDRKTELVDHLKRSIGLES